MVAAPAAAFVASPALAAVRSAEDFDRLDPWTKLYHYASSCADDAALVVGYAKSLGMDPLRWSTMAYANRKVTLYFGDYNEGGEWWKINAEGVYHAFPRTGRVLIPARRV